MPTPRLYSTNGLTFFNQEANIELRSEHLDTLTTEPYVCMCTNSVMSWKPYGGPANNDEDSLARGLEPLGEHHEGPST